MKSRMTSVAGTGETEASIEHWWRKKPTEKTRLGWDDNI
jgi:hypothetical protein